MRTRLIKLTAVAGALLLVTACANATTDAAGSGSGSGSDAPGVTDDTVTFGLDAPLTGPAGALGNDSAAAARAMIAKVNAEGGINGRKLAIETRDNAYDPKKAVSSARYFASEKPVLGMWGIIGAAPALAALPVFKSSNTPLLFPMAPTVELQSYDGYFEMMQPWAEQFKLFSDHVAAQPKEGARKWGFLHQNDGTSAEVAKGLEGGATDITVDAPFELDATSYTSQLGKLKSAGLTDVIVISNPNAFSVILKEADQLGFKPRWWSSLGNTSPDLVKLAGPLAEGVTTINPFVPMASSAQGAQEFRDTMDKYEPKATQSFYALQTWAAGLIIVDALKRAGEDLTHDSFVKALESTSGLKTGGLMPPIDMSKDDHRASECIQLAAVTKGVYQEKGEAICA